MNKNFMIDKNLIRKICDYADLNDNEVVLEIGAGTGNLTAELSKRGKKVIAIERDKRLANFLFKRFKNDAKVEIMKGDAIKISISDFKIDKIVANLPYSISRKITEKILTCKFNTAILVYQKEFAEKSSAKQNTANYRAISVIVQAVSRVEILENIERKAFFPVPDVDSVLVKMTPFSSGQSLDVENFIKFVKEMFNKRNKILKLKEFYGKRIYELKPHEIFEIWKNIKSEKI